MTLVGLYQPSEEAVSIYQELLKKMDSSGFIDFTGCLEMTYDGLMENGELGVFEHYVGELVRAEWVFPQPEKAGWLVCLPPRA